MTSAAIDAHSPLVFSESTSTVVGMHGPLVEWLQKNSGRIVGTMKLAGEIVAGFTGSPIMIVAAALAIIGDLIMIGYGTKENQKKQLEKEKLSHSAPHETSATGKILHPQQYPVESSSGFSMAADMLNIVYGISLFMGGATGYTMVIVGLVQLFANGRILFGKEKHESKNGKESSQKQTQTLVFEGSESRDLGWISDMRGKLKGNPVLASSLTSMAVCVTLVVGSLIEGLPALAVSGAIFLCAFAFQAMFVRKSDLNVEGGQDEIRIKDTHADKIRQRQFTNKDTNPSPGMS